MMNFNRFASLAVVVVSAFVAVPALAAKHKYQVTGPIVEVSDKSIVVRKGSADWELARDPSTQVEGELTPGTKVTIEYTMTATHIEAKPAKGKKK